MTRKFFIHRAKIDRYLLNLSHPTGGGKAKFFLARGFRRDEPTQLEFALRQHTNTSRMVAQTSNRDVVKRVYECFLRCPDGTMPCIRSIWVELHGSEVMRLVTAYPTDPPA